jgi:hypothetical protein
VVWVVASPNVIPAGPSVVAAVFTPAGPPLIVVAMFMLLQELVLIEEYE